MSLKIKDKSGEVIAVLRDDGTAPELLKPKIEDETVEEVKEEKELEEDGTANV